MSNPKEQKNLWKNIDWTTKDEKKAFFNKYFNTTDRSLILKEIKDSINYYKNDLIDFIDTDIIENNVKRTPTIQDVKKYLNK